MKRMKGAFLFLLVFSLTRFQPLVCVRSADENVLDDSVRKRSRGTPDSVSGSHAWRKRNRSALAGASGVPETYKSHPLEFLSRAPVDSIAMLKGIGPVLARRIVRIRSGKGPFTSWKDLLDVRGIGSRKVLELKKQAGIKD